MLQFPDAKRREEKTLGAGESSHSWQFSFHRLSTVIFPGPTAFRLGLASAARGFTDGEMASIVHGGSKKQLVSHCFPLVRDSVLLQFARSCLRIGNWVA